MKTGAHNRLNRTFGYARASWTDPDSHFQIEALSAAHCATIVVETKLEDPPEVGADLQELLKTLAKGDTLVVTQLDRLATNIENLLKVIDDLNLNGVILKATDQRVDTSAENGTMLITALKLFAEFDTATRRERHLQGIAKAKAKGVYKGRKPRIKISRVLALRRSGKPVSAIAHELKIAKSSVYRVLGYTRP
jgi:DNA invertase Pin-like site-specific DNA recombinase